MVKKKHGRLDVLINNAGISRGSGSPCSRLTWRDIFDTNVSGVSVVTDAFLPLLAKSQNTKRIVFITSSLGSMAAKLDRNSSTHNVDARVYTSSKAALNMLALHYVVQFENDPTWKINLCCPGYCATNLNNYEGTDHPSYGAINACQLATLGPDGESGTYSDRRGVIPW